MYSSNAPLRNIFNFAQNSETDMKANQLIIVCFSLLLGACSATPATTPASPDYQAPTVAPEIAEAIPVDTPAHSISKADSGQASAVDTLHTAVVPDTVKKQQPPDPAPKKESEIQSLRNIGPKTEAAVQTVKKETESAAKEIKQAAKDAAQTVKKESNKAAAAVKKATKDLKQELKK